MSDERWLPIAGWVRYEVSDHGRVRRLSGYGCRETRVLNTKRSDGAGYGSVKLSDRKQGQKYFRVHRLALLTFIGPPPSELHEGAHEDGDPRNDHLSNLSWKTKAENSYDRWRHGTQHVVWGSEKRAAIEFLLAHGWPVKAVSRVFEVTTSSIRPYRGNEVIAPPPKA